MTPDSGPPDKKEDPRSTDRCCTAVWRKKP